MTNRQSLHTILALWACVLTQNTLGQVETLDDVTITASRMRNTYQSDDSRIDTLKPRINSDLNLSEHIQTESSIYIRSYGPGLASTVSRHGFSPAQTSVYWNGVPLNSPALGVSDLSTLPSGFQVVLDEGVAGSVYGSGYMGGGIHLLSMPAFPSDIFELTQTAQYRTSGYSNYTTEAEYHTESTTHAASLNYGIGNLNYDYKDLYGVERERLGADQESLHLRYNGTKFWKYSRLDWGAWVSEFDRGIPRSISEAYTEGARQYDQVARAYLKFNSKLSHRWSIGLRSSGYAEDQRYSSFVLSDTNVAIAAYNQLDITGRFQNRIKTILSIDHAYQYVEGSSKDSRSVNRYGSSLVVHYRMSRCWFSSAGARIEHQLTTTPLMPFVDMHWKSFNWDLQVDYRTHFRFPTLNDLFWNLGGNPELRPETGSTAGAHVNYKFGVNRAHRLELSTFISEIENYIQWVPTGGIFEPRNVKRVRTAGVSFGYNYQKTVSAFKLIFASNYTWTRARTIESQRTNDPGLNNQLIYTPEHKATSRLGVEWNRATGEVWALQLAGSFNGVVHTTSDNLGALVIPAFFNLDTELSYTRALQSGLTMRGSFGVRNATDANYSFHRYYPMPGIQAVFSLTLKFKKQ